MMEVDRASGRVAGPHKWRVRRGYACVLRVDRDRELDRDLDTKISPAMLARITENTDRLDRLDLHKKHISKRHQGG